MSDFRSRRGSYIKVRNGRYYYRRAVPASHREMVGKREWIIPLRGLSDTERLREAQAIAAQHDAMLTAETWEPGSFPQPPHDTVEMRIESEGGPTGVKYREGQMVPVNKISVTDDPALHRQATVEGYFAMSRREMILQQELDALRAQHQAAQNDDQRELANMKAANVAAEIDAEARVAGAETVLSVLDGWRAHRKQAPTTWKKHNQYSREFADLHGDLPLMEVTKRHVVQYVEHCQTMTYRGEPISPGSIAKRLDSIKALFSYAASADLVEHSPALGVKPPRDTRPKTSQSWKSFEKAEIQKLVLVATDLWTNRRASRNTGRKDDLITALHCLIWTGARPEEICQLRRADIDLAHLAIIVTNDESDDDARARLVKNDRSTRTIPIHSRLLPILSEHLRRSNSPLLFPSFEPQATPAELEHAQTTGALEIKGRYARPISREWTDYLREKIVPGEPRKVLYSLRHSWAAESRRTGMPEHVRNAIMGHADDNQHASRYGGDADWLELKRDHIERMDYLSA